MSACIPFIETIYPTECLSDSLVKLNTNFTNLQTKICNIKEALDSVVEVRTLWYYGPNAENNPSSGMQTGIISRPSNETIKSFVNSRTQLNLPSISDINDIAYVIFQKTGFQNNQFDNIEVNYNFGDHTDNLYNLYAPSFFVWRLTYNGTEYTISPEWPKIVRAQGQEDIFAAQPQSWSIYNTP